MFVENTSSGLTLRSLIDEIADRVQHHSDLLLRLHEGVSATLGTHLSEALTSSFDDRLAESSLRFFNLADVPGIRGPLPAGVTEVHFRSDLSGTAHLAVHEVTARDPLISDILPPVT